MSYCDLALYIDGHFFKDDGRHAEPVLDPSSGETIGNLPHATSDDLDTALAAADRALAGWRDIGPYARSGILRDAARLIRDRSAQIGEIMTREQGKPLAESASEIAHAADLFDWFAEEGRRAYGRVVPARSPLVEQLVVVEPVGVCAVFTPWNFPALTPARKLAAGLAAGCTMILKASAETPGTAVEIVRALHDAGAPPGVANLVFGAAAEVSDRLISSPIVRKVSFTGSTPIGKHLMTLAAATAKRTTMELGGNAPVIVFEDADLERTLDTLVAGKFRNAGQVCIAPARFFVHESIHDAFVAGFAERMGRIRVGNGLEAGTAMGPLANSRRAETMERLLAEAEAGGAKIHRGETVAGSGFYVAPHMVVGVADSDTLMQEETFGPIAPVVPFSGTDEVLARANAVEAGLAGYAFTRTIDTAHRVTRDLQCGMIGINTLAVSAPEVPFGGMKESGFGAEGGIEGMQAYLSTKLAVRA